MNMLINILDKSKSLSTCRLLNRANVLAYILLKYLTFINPPGKSPNNIKPKTDPENN